MSHLCVMCLLWFAAPDLQPVPAVITALVGDVRIIRQADTVEIAAHHLDHLFDGDSIITGDGRATVLFRTGAFTVIKQHTAALVTLLDAGTVRARKTGLDTDMETFARLFHEASDAEDHDLETVMAIGQDSSTMTIYAPGNTALCTDRPDILWGNVPGANWYAVTIEQGRQTLNDIATTDTFLPYPTQHDSLGAGSYVLRIIAFHNNDSLNGRIHQFTVLTADKIEKAERCIDDIESKSPDSYTARLLSAMVYERYGMKTEAIDNYQVLVMEQPVPFLVRTLALLYAHVGMPKTARQYYELYRLRIQQP